MIPSTTKKKRKGHLNTSSKSGKAFAFLGQPWRCRQWSSGRQGNRKYHIREVEMDAQVMAIPGCKIKNRARLACRGSAQGFCPQMGKGNFSEHNLIFEKDQKPDYSRQRLSGRLLQSALL